MAINPKHMESFLADMGDDDDIDLPVPKGKPGAALPAEEAESAGEMAAEGTLEEEYPVLFQLLEDSGEDFEAAADTLDPNVLHDVNGEFDEDEMLLLREAFDTLPEDIQEAIRSEARGISWEKATQIADALESGEHISDPEGVTGLLFHFANCLLDAEDAGEEEGEAEEEEGEDEEGEDMGEEELPEEEGNPYG